VQLLITVGLCSGYFICYGSINMQSSMSWRFPLAVQAAIAFFVAVVSYLYLPQSPRWLAYKGRRREATVIWDKLGVSNAEREKDLLQGVESTGQHAAPSAITEGGIPALIRRSMANIIGSFGKGARRQMLLGVFMMSMQQLSGIDGVLYVSLAFSHETFRFLLDMRLM
jgi:hypothetical protein